jgi:hypothetical protein
MKAIDSNFKPKHGRKKYQQAIYYTKEMREAIIKAADKNGRTLSQEIVYRVRKSLIEEGLIRD